MNCNSHLTIATDKVLSTGSNVNVNAITMAPTTLRPQPVISGCRSILTNGMIDIGGGTDTTIHSTLFASDDVVVRGGLVLFNGVMSATTTDLKITNNTDFTNKDVKNINAFQSCPPITDITTRLSAVESKQSNIPVLSNLLF